MTLMTFLINDRIFYEAFAEHHIKIRRETLELNGYRNVKGTLIVFQVFPSVEEFIDC